MNINRTHNLNELNKNFVDSEVNLYGWVKNNRNFGELIFIDLGDMYGITQVVVDNKNDELNKIAQSLRNEDTINVKGVVRIRQDINTKISTGEIEVIVSELNIINKASVIPIDLNEESETLEENRFKYRYLDLRRKKVLNNLILRNKISNNLRNFLNSSSFIEIETPMLTKSTPEGARDYLVPSRVNENKFYALPQSPQIYKNLLMNATVDKYYQFTKCFRDEDLRSDRQPEFTQLDMEMAFMSQDEILMFVEKMLKDLMKNVMNTTYDTDFIQMTYKDAMDNYGVDKPDIRYDMKLVDITKIFENSTFNIFKNASYVKAINVKNVASDYSRKKLDKLEEHAKHHGAKGMPWIKFMNNEFSGSIVKVLSNDELELLKDKLNIKENDLVIFASDEYNVVSDVLGNVRTYLAKELNLYKMDDFKFLWITKWPMFEYDDELKRYFAMHHPFTMPENHKFDQQPEDQMAMAYDIVLNGYELGGGSIRINSKKLQLEMFKYLGFTNEEVENEFGFLLEAYSYGAPYHGGIALGFDRLAMILSQCESIKDVIAFPKNNKAIEVMIDSPSFVSESQLEELHINLKGEK